MDFWKRSSISKILVKYERNNNKDDKKKRIKMGRLRFV